MIMLMEFKFQVAVWSLLVIGRRVKLGADGGCLPASGGAGIGLGDPGRRDRTPRCDGPAVDSRSTVHGYSQPLLIPSSCAVTSLTGLADVTGLADQTARSHRDFDSN